MNLTFDFIHMEASEAVRELVHKKIDKLQRYVHYPLEAKIRIGVDGNQQWIEITCRAEHKQLVAEAATADLYEAIDLAIHKLEAQLKKEREKRKGHEAAHQDLENLAQDVGATIPHLGKKP